MPINIFSKKIHDGTVDIGLEISKPLNDHWTILSRSDWVGDHLLKMGKNIAGSSFTQEFSFNYTVTRDFILNVYYRYYYVPSKVDIFNLPVPEVTDLVGIGIKYGF